MWDVLTNRKPDNNVVTSASFGECPAGKTETVILRKMPEFGKEYYFWGRKIVDDIVDSATSITEGRVDQKYWCSAKTE